MGTITQFALKIDGNDYALSNIRPFYQKAPFPGRHYYELIIEANNHKDFKNLLHDTDLENLDENNWDMFFMGLLGLMLRHINFGFIEYYLNTVEELTVLDKKIILKGQCSEYIDQNH